MRNGHIVAAVVAFFGFAAPTSAATLTTTGTTCTGSVCYGIPARLASFDSSLGLLTGISLQVDYTASASFNLYDPSGQAGTATLSWNGPANALLNGVTYSVLLIGSVSQPYGAYQYISGPDIFASGSATFVLDRSLFASFIDHSNACGGSVGICGYALTASPPNLQVTGPLQILDDYGSANFSLTYSYSLWSDVPEPASWAMMLIGFAAIGFALRRSSGGSPTTRSI